MDNIAIESFIQHCDEMMIAEEGFFNFKKNNKSCNSSNNEFTSIRDVLNSDVGSKYCTIKKDNVSVTFHDDVLNKIDHKEIFNLYNKIMSKKSNIVSLIANGAYRDLKGDMSEERRDEIIKNSYIDYIDFYLNDNDKLDASVYAYDAEQFYLKNVNSKGFSIKNVDYQD